MSRPELEQRIYAQLATTEDKQQNNGTKTVVIWGLGGAGKSQLALRYVQQHQQQYQAVFWIEAGQRATIERDYLQIYRQLCTRRNVSAAISPEEAVTGVKSWLQGQEGWYLWVMDSADEVEDDTSEVYIDLHHYLPQASHLDRIVTTRSSRVGVISTQPAIEVKAMTEEEAIDLFRQCAGFPLQCKQDEQDVQEVTKIVKELGCLALAVTLAGSYVREDPEMSLDVSQYLVEFQQYRAQILDQKPHRLVHQYGESVLSTWEISLNRVKRHSSIAAQLLNMLGCLHFNDIFLELFALRSASSDEDDYETYNHRIELKSRNRQPIREKQHLNSSRGQASPPARLKWVELMSSEGAIVNHHSIKSAFKVLQAYSLISWRGDQQAYCMHKLVHAWSHDRLSIEQRRAWSLAVLELLSAVISDYRQGDVSIERLLIPHVVSNCVAVSAASKGAQQIPALDRQCLSSVADLLYRLGQWDAEYEVRVLLQRLTSLTLGPEHPDTLTSTTSVAEVLKEQGKYEEAEQIHKQIIERRETSLGHEHPDTLESMNDLAAVLSQQGKYQQAEQLHQQTLELQKEVLGREHPYTLLSMNNLATVLKEQSRYKEAEQLHRQTLELLQKVLGCEHPYTLLSRNNLGTVLREQGEYEDAEQLHQQTLELQKRVLGHEHPYTLVSMHNLALVLGRQGKYEQAKQLNRQTLELRRKVLGHEHPETLASKANLARLPRERDKDEQAAALHP